MNTFLCPNNIPMIFHIRSVSLLSTLFFCVNMVVPSVACAQAAPFPFVPNAADISRIKPEENVPRRDFSQDKSINISVQKGSAPVPEAAKSVKFNLKSVNIIGATAFSIDELSDIYSEYIGKEITLDVVYMMAGAITERYRNAGYFLSRAYIPAQEIDKGNVTINIVEGYVGAVEGLKEFANSDIIQREIAHLTKLRPLSSDAIERFLLLMNDLPGQSFGGTLSPFEESKDGAVKLTLTMNKGSGAGIISYDNYSSRFLGPNEIAASYSTSFIPFQQTTVSALSDTERSKLRYGTIDHTVSIASDVRLQLSGGITQALPGFTLQSSEIESFSKFASLSLEYQVIRQRQQNLSIKGGLDGRNVTSDILGTPLTRDFIRAFRATANYDVVDSWLGSNNANLIISRGINGLSSSNANDPNLSRAGAVPDFTKVELSLSRMQSLTQDWSAYISGAGQWASGVLYSSEQFGYGGQSFGRAYDASDITGDRGLKGAFELRYGGFANDGNLINLQPYSFYDIGVVWNDAVGQPPEDNASSFGFGMRFNTEWKQSGNLGVAWPIDRNITTPIYGSGSTHGPRIILQISQQF